MNQEGAIDFNAPATTYAREDFPLLQADANIEALRSARLTSRWFVAALRREIGTALLLGIACGVLVALIVWIWRADWSAAFVIGGSIALSLISACLFGLGVPSLLHRFKLDPKIAAGPITLALADIFALVFYFTGAWVVFG